MLKHETGNYSSSRDPWPIEKFENEFAFTGREAEQKSSYEKPTHLAQMEDPWNRLVYSTTLSSNRHEAAHHDPAAPRDNLDFKLKTLYNQHSNLFKNRSQIMWQAETVHPDQCGRQLKNRDTPMPVVVSELNHPLRIHDPLKRENPHSVKCGISSHHSQETNKGYTRKPDGGFYSS